MSDAANSGKPQGFSTAQITLHWVSAVLVIGAFVTHETMIAAVEAVEKGDWAGYDFASLVHIVGGVVVFFLTLWRLSILSRRGAPAIPEDELMVLQLISILVKVLLYVIMIVMPVSGVLNWFGGIGLAGQLHVLLEPVIPLTVLLHFVGALYQQYWLKSGLLTRMVRADRAS